MSELRTSSRTLTGRIVSDKMNKTIIVSVQRRDAHAVYGKVIKRTTKLHAHDADNQCKIGDHVVLKETKPYSKTKSWKLVEVVGKVG